MDCQGTSGQCLCRPNVIGRRCDQCKEGYWNIDSQNGCEPCNCDKIGSKNSTCDQYSGKCYCRPGITGVKCDQCETNYYGFSADGCSGKWGTLARLHFCLLLESTRPTHSDTFQIVTAIMLVPHPINAIMTDNVPVVSTSSERTARTARRTLILKMVPVTTASTVTLSSKMPSMNTGRRSMKFANSSRMLSENPILRNHQTLKGSWRRFSALRVSVQKDKKYFESQRSSVLRKLTPKSYFRGSPWSGPSCSGIGCGSCEKTPRSAKQHRQNKEEAYGD